MKTYLINSFHYVTEDNFKEGETGMSIHWDLEREIIKSENPKEAIKEYFENTLYLPFSIEFLDSESPFIRYTNLVDSDNLSPTHNDIESWKRGIKKLYSLNTTIEIYELTRVITI